MSTRTGTAALVRQALRRDRALASVWVLVLLLTCYASAAATPGLYPTERQQVAAAQAIDATPSVVALYGPVLDVHSLGELAMTKMTVLYAVLVAVMCLVLVRRHTRGEEESGRGELLAGTAVGRDAPLAAAVTEAVLVAAVLGVLAAGVNAAAGLPVIGSLAFGASWTGVGMVAAAVTAVACQVSASARTCGGWAVAAVGGLYVVRAAGDATGSWWSWLSPFGWSTRLRAYGETRWWVLLLYVVLTAVLVGTAQWLRTRRDLGSGLVAARPGSAVASPRLSTALALAVRLHASMLLGWTVAMAAVGLVVGAVAPQVGDLLDSSSARRMVQRLGGVGLLPDTLLAAELSVVAVVVTCYGVAVVGHAGSDEQDGRSEQVLATAAPRSAAFAATLLVALLGATWLLLVTGIGAALGGAAAGAALAPGDVGAALAHAPAVWVTTSLAALCFSLRGSWAPIGWAVLVVFVTLGQVGELLALPARVVGVSPYAHVPAMPAADFATAPELALTLVAVVVLVVAWLRYSTRDIR